MRCMRCIDGENNRGDVRCCFVRSDGLSDGAGEAATCYGCQELVQVIRRPTHPVVLCYRQILWFLATETQILTWRNVSLEGRNNTCMCDVMLLFSSGGWSARCGKRIQMDGPGEGGRRWAATICSGLRCDTDMDTTD